MAASAAATVALVSCDGQRLEVPIEDACASKTICTIMRASARFREGAEDCINFPSVTGAVLSEAVRFLPLKRNLDVALANENRITSVKPDNKEPLSFRTKVARSIHRFEEVRMGKGCSRTQARRTPAYEAARAAVRFCGICGQRRVFRDKMWGQERERDAQRELEIVATGKTHLMTPQVLRFKPRRCRILDLVCAAHYFELSNLVSICSSIISQNLTRVRSFGADVPDELVEGILRKCNYESLFHAERIMSRGYDLQRKLDIGRFWLREASRLVEVSQIVFDAKR